jgi:hypothetical protein
MKLIKPFILVCIVTFFCGVTYILGWNAGLNDPKPVVLASALPQHINEQDLYSKVVDFKKSKGLTAPTINQSLCKYAELRMGTLPDNWSHDIFFEDWKYSITPFYHQSENLAKRYFSAEDVLDSWIKSPTHLQVLMTNDSYLCIRCDNINGTNYCVYESAY